MQHNLLIEDIVAQLSSVRGVQSIVLGGSYASEMNLPDSDIDLAIYYSETQPLDTAQVRAIATSMNDTANPVVTDLGGWGRWVNGGAWLTIGRQRVDFLYRNSDFVSRILDDCMNGIFEVDYFQQPPYGFYSYMYCAETQICKPLFDPGDILPPLKAKVAMYPQALKRTIIQGNLQQAAFALEVAQKAAKRGDVYFTAGCVTRVMSILVQVLYALNETFFLSEKNLSKQIGAFKVLPNNFAKRVDAILSNLGGDAEQLMQTIASTYSLLYELEAFPGSKLVTNAL